MLSRRETDQSTGIDAQVRAIITYGRALSVEDRVDYLQQQLKLYPDIPELVDSYRDARTDYRVMTND